MDYLTSKFLFPKGRKIDQQVGRGDHPGADVAVPPGEVGRLARPLLHRQEPGPADRQPGQSHLHHSGQLISLELPIVFCLLGKPRSCNLIMTGSISFLPPFTQEEKKYLDFVGPGELALQAGALSIAPWHLGHPLLNL